MLMVMIIVIVKKEIIKWIVSMIIWIILKNQITY